MSLSSFCVVTNALRLNLFRMYDGSRDKKRKNKAANQNSSFENKFEKQQKQEETKMTKTMKIEGMMCGHCEARVKKCLEALPGVEEAAVSHEAGTAEVSLAGEVADEALKKAVEDQDYKVLAIE